MALAANLARATDWGLRSVVVGFSQGIGYCDRPVELVNMDV